MEHLLSLPTYHSQTLNEFYAQAITREFTEFEEFQDQAVDAILDLCEDENEQVSLSFSSFPIVHVHCLGCGLSTL